MKDIYIPRVYYRLLADGTVIGPTHTRQYLHYLVKAHKQHEGRFRDHLSTRHD